MIARIPNLIGSSIIRQRAAPNCVAIAALVYNFFFEEGHLVCHFEVTLCNIGLILILFIDYIYSSICILIIISCVYII